MCLVVHCSTYLTALIVFRRPPRLTRTSLCWRRTVAQCHPTRTCSRTIRRCNGLTILVRLTCESEASRNGNDNCLVVLAQLPTLSHDEAWKE
jgi:hypothetical protein